MSPSAVEGPLGAAGPLYRDGLEEKPKVEMPKVTDLGMPSFKDPLEKREYLKRRQVLAFRIFAKYGFDDGVAGHITVRDPVEPTSFWLNPFGKAWATMTVDDLILVDKDGKVVDGGPNRLVNAAAYAIHHEVHAARPDAVCVAHSHSVHGKAFSALGRGLDMITQDACAFYGDVALYASRGIVLDAEEGRAIAAALGATGKAVILRNHGLLTCGGSVESCVFWYLALERSCQAQLLADAAAAGRGGGQTLKISDEDAAYTYKTAGSEIAGWFSAKPVFEVAEAEMART